MPQPRGLHGPTSALPFKDAVSAASSRLSRHPPLAPPLKGGVSGFIEAREALGFVLGGQRADQLVELAFQYLRQAVEGQVDAVVGDAALREIVGADALGAVARADHRLARAGALARHPLALHLETGRAH